jgi:FkbM family methyltransferase
MPEPTPADRPAFPVIHRQKACRHGQMLYNFHDTLVGRSLDLYGEYSLGEVAMFGRLIGPGQMVLEVGANIGAHTLFLARHVGYDGLVVAFEPQRVLFQLLCANMALNSVPNVLCLQQAVGARSGVVKVPVLDFTRDANYCNLDLGEHVAGDDVPLVALDDYNMNRCDFLKADVEAMEEQVLRGAAELIRRCRPILYVENDKPQHAQSLMQYIDSLDYRMYWHRPLYFNPDNYFKNPLNVFQGRRSLNMVCVPASAEHDLSDLERI